MTSLLDVRNLSVEIPLPNGTLRPVRDVSFTVEHGERLCIVGESGCGKSLTSLAVMNLLPDAARYTVQSMRFEDQELSHLPERAMSDIRGAKIGMIFQDPMTSLNPSFTIGNQLQEVLRRHSRVTAKAARERAKDLLARVGIGNAEDRLRQFPHQLSGGLRQRVMIAMALMCEPKLLIADEPTTALDVTIQVQILRLLEDLCREFRMGLILITHDLGVVARMAHRVAVMYAGQIVEIGDTAEIFDRPAHPYTRALLRCIPVPGKLRPGAPLGSIPGNVPSFLGAATGCAFKARCDHASEICAAGVELTEMSATQQVRCVKSAPALELGPRVAR